MLTTGGRRLLQPHEQGRVRIAARCRHVQALGWLIV
jgi:hypothetical protein